MWQVISSVKTIQLFGYLDEKIKYFVDCCTNDKNGKYNDYLYLSLIWNNFNSITLLCITEVVNKSIAIDRSTASPILVFCSFGHSLAISGWNSVCHGLWRDCKKQNILAGVYRPRSKWWIPNFFQLIYQQVLASKKLNTKRRWTRHLNKES